MLTKVGRPSGPADNCMMTTTTAKARSNVSVVQELNQGGEDFIGCEGNSCINKAVDNAIGGHRHGLARAMWRCASDAYGVARFVTAPPSVVVPLRCAALALPRACGKEANGGKAVDLRRTKRLRRCNSNCVEARLYTLLRRMAPEARRVTLARRLSEGQRLALERWILSQGKRHKAGGSHAEGSYKKKTARQGSWLPGILRRQSAYAASISAGPFRLFTRCDADLQRVLRFQRLLASIRRRMLAAVAAVGAHDPSAVEAAFRQALAEEPAKAGLDMSEDLGLSFFAIVPTKYWIGRELHTPRYPVSELTAGLGAWRRLAELRSLVYRGRTNRHTTLDRLHSANELDQAWNRLREAYIDIWAQAGRDADRVEAQLSKLETRRAKQRQHMSEAQRLCELLSGRPAAVIAYPSKPKRSIAVSEGELIARPTFSVKPDGNAPSVLGSQVAATFSHTINNMGNASMSSSDLLLPASTDSKTEPTLCIAGRMTTMERQCSTTSSVTHPLPFIPVSIPSQSKPAISPDLVKVGQRRKTRLRNADKASLGQTACQVEYLIARWSRRSGWACQFPPML